jgi:hypothetical protein
VLPPNFSSLVTIRGESNFGITPALSRSFSGPICMAYVCSGPVVFAAEGGGRRKASHLDEIALQRLVQDHALVESVFG